MVNEDILLLVGEINKSLEVLNDINALYDNYAAIFSQKDQRDIRDAVLLADILCNTYTCIETLLLRISRLFENHLDSEQWHKELLRKMHIEIPGIRKAVLSQETYELLDELRRFQHFKRYYYDFKYDWSRLDFLRNVYERVFPLVKNDMEEYVTFLMGQAQVKE
ncbi:hypothetical protein L3556_02205 [Candidatus Synechococcus calcipolaris G9]|uniref:HepT-like domain-containing protein n=1 Tax=Candidatus Synechococcus calcipolaris G9 TaxID=1497997 RepID=A0ABT6EVD3_9SYNE|nr:hypothetical protein [Candidatus Synechococcus calcipolaris]MDG2989753.1 hypothetical protein [Candidatus Synechococcus calcipolaris G9]